MEIEKEKMYKIKELYDVVCGIAGMCKNDVNNFYSLFSYPGSDQNWFQPRPAPAPPPFTPRVKPSKELKKKN